MNSADDLGKFVESKIKELNQMKYEMACKEHNIESLKQEKVNLEESKAMLLTRMGSRYKLFFYLCFILEFFKSSDPFSNPARISKNCSHWILNNSLYIVVL